ncbi:MAG: hypothetical protein ACMG6E_07590 [Candidatus Roizmanbacteria bacterium]
MVYMTEGFRDKFYGTYLPMAAVVAALGLWLRSCDDGLNSQCLREGEGLGQALERTGGFSYPVILRFPDGHTQVIGSGRDLIDGTHDTLPAGTCFDRPVPTATPVEGSF